jgi:hypothetical protein
MGSTQWADPSRRSRCGKARPRRMCRRLSPVKAVEKRHAVLSVLISRPFAKTLLAIVPPASFWSIWTTRRLVSLRDRGCLRCVSREIRKESGAFRVYLLGRAGAHALPVGP